MRSGTGFLGLRTRLSRLSPCHRGSGLLGPEFSQPRVPFVKFSIENSNAAKVQTLEGSQFCLEASKQEFLLGEFRLKPRKFISLSCKLFLFR